ncbi:MAG: MaoC/PaaZ C-terminal domain-containing protein [Wenzhouxiangellaceae bacterium]
MNHSLAWAYLRLLPKMFRRQPSSVDFETLTLTWDQLAFDQQHYQRYARFFEIEQQRIHPLYCYILGQGPQLALLNHRDFPFAPAGVVHLRNQTLSHQPLLDDQPYRFSLSAQLEEQRANGYQLLLTSTLHQQDQLCAVNRTWALARLPGKVRRGDREPPPTPAYEPFASLVMPADVGRRYARVSGDYNPIHLRRWLARRFGFRQPIAHGMYSLMRVVSVIERQSGLRSRQIDVRFLRPVYLPSVSGLAYEDGAQGMHFELSDDHGHLQMAGHVNDRPPVISQE